MLDDETEQLERCKYGELWVRGPNIMTAYWRNPTATAATLTADRWLKTGDVAYVDENNKWYIVDRKKELIKVRGAQVAPAEIEALLLDHPQIVDAAVVGVKTSKGDEEPRAYIIARNRELITSSEVTNYVRTQLSKHKRLTGGVVFVDQIPKTAAGKTRRAELRERANRERRGETGSRL